MSIGRYNLPIGQTSTSASLQTSFPGHDPSPSVPVLPQAPQSGTESAAVPHPMYSLSYQASHPLLRATSYSDSTTSTTPTMSASPSRAAPNPTSSLPRAGARAHPRTRVAPPRAAARAWATRMATGSARAWGIAVLQCARGRARP